MLPFFFDVNYAEGANPISGIFHHSSKKKSFRQDHKLPDPLYHSRAGGSLPIA